MADQWTSDWDARFRAGDTPWEENIPSDAMISFLKCHVRPGSRVLDVGCGLGTNAIWMAAYGYEVEAVDISETAILQATARAAQVGVAVKFRVMDFLEARDWNNPFQCVVDRGCLHSIRVPAPREVFAQRVSEALSKGGLWIDISGSADNPNSLEDRELLGYPRLSIADIAAATERRFEIVDIRKCDYGTTSDTRFLAFATLLKRR
ncbi:MAG: class I SAM-dependent methyltransferase [Phycisphaerae bacterium]|jgi:cyclopropane fatty-acyl-phospholipid synthase-like methyltransferase